MKKENIFITMMASYVMMWKRMFDFESKVDLKNYLSAMLMHLVVFIDLILLNAIERYAQITDFGSITITLIMLYFLLSFPAVWTMSARRLNDVSRHKGALFLIFIPFAGWLILCVLLLSKSRDITSTRDRIL